MDAGRILIKSLDEDLVEPLLEYLKRDMPASILCIRDLLDPDMRKKSEFRVALKEGKVRGFSLIYRVPTPPVLWIGGTRKSASKLAELLSLDRAIVFTWPNLAEVVRHRLPVSSQEEMAVMMLERGNLEIDINHKVEDLDKQHAPDVLEAFKVSGLPAPPDSMEVVKMILERSNCYSIIKDDRVVSFTNTYKLESVPGYANVGMVFTIPDHREKGFATSVTSKAVSELFDDPGVQKVVLLAKRRNVPAMHLYQRIGFDVHGTLIHMGLNFDISLEE